MLSALAYALGSYQSSAHRELCEDMSTKVDESSLVYICCSCLVLTMILQTRSTVAAAAIIEPCAAEDSGFLGAPARFRSGKKALQPRQAGPGRLHPEAAQLFWLDLEVALSE